MRPLSRNVRACTAHSAYRSTCNSFTWLASRAACDYLVEGYLISELILRKAGLPVLVMVSGMLCVLGLAMTGCEPAPAPEEAARLWVRAAEAAAEDRDRGAVLELVSDSYADPRGNDKEDIGNILRILFLRNQSVVLASKIDEVTMLGDTAAMVLVTAGMAGTSDGMFGLTADAWRFELELEDTGDGFQLIAARWAQVGSDFR